MSDFMNECHPRWNEFLSELSNYSIDCQHDTTMTEKILTEMCVDVPSTLEYLRSEGGCCDCLVIRIFGEYQTTFFHVMEEKSDIRYFELLPCNGEYKFVQVPSQFEEFLNNLQ